MMNPEIKAKWVTALRSGDYTQIAGRLKGTTRHCCLGVLCEVSKLETGFGIDENAEQVRSGSQSLGYTILEWSGLTNAYGDSVKIGGITGTLSNHNDTTSSFNTIADAIEAQL